MRLMTADIGRSPRDKNTSVGQQRLGCARLIIGRGGIDGKFRSDKRHDAAPNSFRRSVNL
jgi:hypothetical protein